jgi:glycosyltransferase involved in cell wall biosynthesis
MLPESNGSTARVTVFVPVFNAEKFLAEAVESILGQTFTDFELLVVDDGSTDRSIEILESFGDRRIRISRNDRNRGRSYTRNRGIELARGEYLSVLDADDLCEPDRLERQVQFLDAHPNVAAVGSSATYIDENSNAAYICRVPASNDEIHQRIFQSNCFVHSSVTFRRQVLIDIGGYNPDLQQAEDYELFLRLIAHHRLANIEEPLVQYRIHPDQVSQRELSKQRDLADRVRVAAYKYQYSKGLILPGVSPPSRNVSDRLRGKPGTVGSDYFGWISTYRALGREDVSRSLVWHALINAPLASRAWQEVWDLAMDTMFTPSQRKTIRWYFYRAISILRSGSDT